MQYVGSCSIEALKSFNVKYYDWPILYFLWTLYKSNKAHTKKFYTDSSNSNYETYYFINLQRVVKLLGDSIDFSNPEILGRKLKFFKQCKILKVEVIQTKWGKKLFYRFTKEAEEIIFSNNQSKYKKATSMIPDDINEDDDKNTIVIPCDNNIEIAEDLNVDIANDSKETYPQGLNVGIPLDKKVEYTNCITNTDKITTTDIQTEITEFLCEHFGQNNNFTSNFVPTLCKMLESRSSSFILSFLKCCFTTAQAKNNPKAYFYKTAINPSVLNDFEVSYKPPVEDGTAENE